ncbi:MAG: T3SS effector HopA1 family protein [Nostoc sp. DedQUE08]|uniref:T3SS effector HopA1 family protein n=1 Tax=Nostoc sp. DedQUE08 TaxID=3075393 RepID=UPI002AD50445|nr:T3SS effector HopA1 family protein [Nostoc sp. DedQUE08]MDZ8065170.1 T3SS effector HopA1 family protein [Nostoc sp. DedQUE08]
MQLLDSLQSQLLTSAPDQVLDSLEDIANNVQIQSNFCITHPAYKPFEIPAEVVTRFQRIPLELQNKYLSLQLQSFLYGIYYNGSMQAALAADASSDNLALHQNLENNTFLGVDLEFYDRLHKSNTGEGYFDPGWSVLRQESDGSLAVTKGGLTLHIERDRHLQLTEQSASVGNIVAIRMPRNLVQNGFYMAVSDAGPDTYPQTVRVYFNLTPEGAIAVMESLTRQLNQIKIPFTFKVLYNPSDYGRYDSGVLYFEKSNYEAIRQVLKNVYAEKRCLRRASPTHFRTEVPLFTKLLAPGLALAEEPDCKFAAVESFGMNRCQIVANGLLEARATGDESPQSRMAAIHQHFSLLGIDWQHSYLNANSLDIYTPLDQ